MYSYLIDGEEDSHRRAKGIQRAVVEREIRHEDYIEQLRQASPKSLVNRRIQSSFHELYTIRQEKRALSAYDDKRYMLEDGVHTLAFANRRLILAYVDEDLKDEEEDPIIKIRIYQLNPNRPQYRLMSKNSLRRRMTTLRSLSKTCLM